MKRRELVHALVAALVVGCAGEESAATTDGGSDVASSSSDTGIDSTSPEGAIETDAIAEDAIAEEEGGTDAIDARPDGGTEAEAEADVDECGGVTYAGDVQGIWSAHCAVPGCHTGAVAVKPDLSPGVSWSDIVGVPAGEMPSIAYVKPGDPTDSWLYQKVTSGHPPGASLSDAEKNEILQWILCGAPP